MGQVRRRQFLIAAGALLAPPLRATAQPAKRVARIGWLGLRDAKGDASASIPLDGLRAGLRERGWIEGENLVIEMRSGDFGNAQQLTTELVQSKIEVLVAEGGMVFRARGVSGATPLVFHVNGDPVEAKLVASYPRPGGNMTGVTALSAELSGKRVQLLREALPHMSRVAAIANQGHPGWQVEHKATEAAAVQLGLQLSWLPVFSAQDFAAALDAVARDGAQGIVAVPDNLILGQAKLIAEFATARNVPAISGFAEFTSAGNLMSYGPVLRDSYARMANYVDRILKGTKPGDLPVENPTRFEMVVNLGVAKALKLKVPQSLLLRADRVIE
jgi:putative ABC transport system substrate-binding protein